MLNHRHMGSAYRICLDFVDSIVYMYMYKGKNIGHLRENHYGLV